MIDTESNISDFLSDTQVLSLPNLRASVQPEISEFRSFFKEAVRTDVSLLNHLLTYLLKTKGKEMRPMLVFLSAKTCGGVSNRTNIAATMVELLHTATLIHDDVVDEAEQRRGFLSINKIWKNKAGVLLGDYLLAKGLLVALDHDEFRLLKILSETVRRMSEGELRQLKASKLQNTTEEKYFEIISGKTASLISACCECGAVSATEDEVARKKMQEIGELIGLAFQIKDDLLDYGSEDIGKPTANDIQEKKITLPLIAAFNQAPPKVAKTIRKKFKKEKKSKKEIREITEFVHNYGGIEYANNKMLALSTQAWEILNTFEDTEARSMFANLIRFVITRKK
jgi:octaprenyl-diphosphate synthase